MTTDAESPPTEDDVRARALFVQRMAAAVGEEKRKEIAKEGKCLVLVAATYADKAAANIVSSAEMVRLMTNLGKLRERDQSKIQLAMLDIRAANGIPCLVVAAGKAVIVHFPA